MHLKIDVLHKKGNSAFLLEVQIFCADLIDDKHILQRDMMLSFMKHQFATVNIH